MSNANTPSFPDFGKLVPGFDFLQNLAKQAAGSATQAIPQLPNLGNWIAPTLNVEELDKRVQELKAVQFWLDQNAAALKATIQALEVQKMTLATLKGMNFNMGDVANAFKLKVGDSVAGGMQRMSRHGQELSRGWKFPRRPSRRTRPMPSRAKPLQNPPAPRLKPSRSACRRQRGGPDAVVGRADPAVPDHCRRSDEGSRQDHRPGCHQEHGHRNRQGRRENRHRHGQGHGRNRHQNHDRRRTRGHEHGAGQQLAQA